MICGKKDNSIIAEIEEGGFTFGTVVNVCAQRISTVTCHPRISDDCVATERKWSFSDEGITTVFPSQNISISEHTNLRYDRGTWTLKGAVYLACFIKERETGPLAGMRGIEDGLICQDS